MLRSLVEQKRALGIFGSEHELPDNISVNQWSLLEKTITVLAPFEELTRQVSSSDASASDVIPAVTVLQKWLAKETDEDRGIRTMKNTLLAAVKKRLSDMENPLYGIASLLNPSNTNTAREAKVMVIQELQKMSGGDADKQVEHEEPPIRRPRRDQPSSSLDSV
ncbi:hypothetical protein AAFF_G00194510 [Aldrovandia affinis]|uniref:Uncharacterized protein n=1 Tax=Aldrovandia affinis TaxID=143900 RepID=A0AAD7WVB0_9TELE|nr:hypothetical protein AAFF_G00194510 [Aldrovandia affinis]